MNLGDLDQLIQHVLKNGGTLETPVYVRVVNDYEGSDPEDKYHAKDAGLCIPICQSSCGDFYENYESAHFIISDTKM